MKITIIQQIEDMDEPFKVFVFRGKDEKSVLNHAFDKYEELIGIACDKRRLLDNGVDNRIVEGSAVNNSWTYEFNPDWHTDWSEILWKFRESTDYVTIRVYRKPIITEETVYPHIPEPYPFERSES